mgnify:CR=1 FL=1
MTGPGTATTSRPSSCAHTDVRRALLLDAPSTTTVAWLSAAMIRDLAVDQLTRHHVGIAARAARVAHAEEVALVQWPKVPVPLVSARTTASSWMRSLSRSVVVAFLKFPSA